MAGYFSPTDQKRELEEKELKVKMEKATEKILTYSLWYSKKINALKQEIAKQGFKFTFGIEIIDSNLKKDEKNLDGIKFYDMASISGLAFDNHAQCMIYYFSNPGIYDAYCKSEEVNVFEYDVIPFKDIKKAKLEIDSSTITEATSSKTGVITRSIIGGLIAGEAGAIIGGLSGSEVTQTSSISAHNSCEMIIYTGNEKYPVIKFLIEKLQNCDAQSQLSREMVVNVTDGIFTDTIKENYFDVIANTVKEYGASNGTYTPCEMGKVYDLVCERNIFSVNLEKYHHEIKALNKTFDSALYKKFCTGLDEAININKTIKKLQEIVRKIESIVLNSESNTSSGSNIIDQLEKLIKIKIDGFITDEEFALFKKKLIEN